MLFSDVPVLHVLHTEVNTITMLRHNFSSQNQTQTRAHLDNNSKVSDRVHGTGLHAWSHFCYFYGLCVTCPPIVYMLKALSSVWQWWYDGIFKGWVLKGSH